MKRQRVDSGSPWEKHFGYARLVRAGSYVAISGTVAADALGRASATGSYAQTLQIFRGFEKALAEVGGTLRDIVRLRVHFVEPDIAPGFLDALKETFPEGSPALTTVRVVALVSKDFLLEIEADAICEEPKEDRPARRAQDWTEPVD